MTSNPFLTTQPPYYRTNNDILWYIIDFFKKVLSSWGINGWQVIQSNQPTIQAIQNNTVYIDCISKKRLGVQARKSLTDANGNWWNGDIWYEEWILQVSGFQQRIPIEEDQLMEYTSQDIITLLQATINGALTNTINTHWVQYAPQSQWEGDFKPYTWAQLIRSTEIKEIVYETDSGLKEKYPTFDFTLVIEQGLQSSLPTLDHVEIATHPL